MSKTLITDIIFLVRKNFKFPSRQEHFFFFFSLWPSPLGIDNIVFSSENNIIAIWPCARLGLAEQYINIMYDDDDIRFCFRYRFRSEDLPAGRHVVQASGQQQDMVELHDVRRSGWPEGRHLFLFIFLKTKIAWKKKKAPRVWGEGRGARFRTAGFKSVHFRPLTCQQSSDGPRD